MARTGQESLPRPRAQGKPPDLLNDSINEGVPSASPTKQLLGAGHFRLRWDTGSASKELTLYSLIQSYKHYEGHKGDLRHRLTFRALGAAARNSGLSFSTRPQRPPSGATTHPPPARSRLARTVQPHTPNPGVPRAPPRPGVSHPLPGRPRSPAACRELWSRRRR